MRDVYVATDLVDAELVKSRLAAAGIEAVVQGAGAFALRGELPMTTDTLPTVCVLDDAALDRARAIVEDHRRALASAAAGPRTPWTCPRCGETLEPQFTDCWQCGTARPGSI
jgi:hypothetical protein